MQTHTRHPVISADVVPEECRRQKSAPEKGSAVSAPSLSIPGGSPPPVQLKPNNTGIPDNLKHGIETLSGYSMDDVKVHYNSSAPAQLQAHAYAQGSDIHIAPGQEKHLPHEAWHVVQQKQGRVQPTAQLKDKLPLNDDSGLEKEADMMGAKAAQMLKTARYTPLNPAPVRAVVAPVQARFIKLSEERILAVRNAAKEKGEDLDTDYLQGLYIKEEDGENDDPPLFFKVILLNKAYLTRQLNDTLGPKVQMFAKVETVEDAEKKEAALKDEINEEDRLNVLQILNSDLELWTLQETGPYKVSDIKQNARDLFGTELGNKAENDIIGNVLLGGLEEDAGGGYGSIEFRFKAAAGDLYLMEGEEYQKPKEEFETYYPQLRVIQESGGMLARIAEVYYRAGLPYDDERVSNDYVFVEESLIGAFTEAYIEFLTGGNITARESGKDLPKASAGAPLPPAPLASPKIREKEYRYRAVRGSRDAGQKAAMSNYSAKDYVKRFSPEEAGNSSWEWLHIQGSRLGGPNRPENLVAGTAGANTHMIPYERAIFELSALATNSKPLKVKWTATLRNDGDGNRTHVGKEIGIEAKFPNGTPDVEEDSPIDPAEALKLFPGKFKASDGAPFTKRDRDLLDDIKYG